MAKKTTAKAGEKDKTTQESSNPNNEPTPNVILFRANITP